MLTSFSEHIQAAHTALVTLNGGANKNDLVRTKQYRGQVKSDTKTYNKFTRIWKLITRGDQYQTLEKGRAKLTKQLHRSILNLKKLDIATATYEELEQLNALTLIIDSSIQQGIFGHYKQDSLNARLFAVFKQDVSMLNEKASRERAKFFTQQFDFTWKKMNSKDVTQLRLFETQLAQELEGVETNSEYSNELKTKLKEQITQGYIRICTQIQQNLRRTRLSPQELKSYNTLVDAMVPNILELTGTRTTENSRNLAGTYEKMVNDLELSLRRI